MDPLGVSGTPPLSYPVRRVSNASDWTLHGYLSSCCLRGQLNGVLVATNPIRDDASEPKSIFQSDLPLAEKLDRARTELLDLSARNRLLNMPRAAKSAKAIEIIDELSAEIFRLLVREGKPFTFAAGRAASSAEIEDADGEEVDEIVDLAQPEDDVVDDRGIHARHSDTRLQTRLTPKGLQKRLLELYFDARTLEACPSSRRSSSSVMSRRAPCSAKIVSRCASIRCERVSPPCALAA